MEITNTAFIGNYIPRQCGIATFTSDLCRSVSSVFPEMSFYVLPVNDTAEGYDYPEEVRFEIQEEDINSYLRAAEYLNINNIDVVSLQHEFGIFGGSSGNYIVPLLKNLNMPVVTTLHTVFQNYNDDQRRVIKEIIQTSTRIVVMTRKALELLNASFPGYKDKIDVIAHGIPDLPFVDPSFYKDEFGMSGKNVLLTFGLLSENKGVENVIKALPKIVSAFPDTVYIILGATHPKVFRETGDAYRLGLERLAVRLGVQKNIVFYNRFLDIKELTQFICACDIYLTPYLHEEQIVSGTLSYAFGAGKAVVSTPYWHAAELLSEGMGILVPFSNSDRIVDAVISLLSDPVKANTIRKNAYLKSREFVWQNVARKYMRAFQKARSEFRVQKIRIRRIKTLDQCGEELPALNMSHIARLTDNTGIIQHATFTVPSFTEGYCTDDNARALILSILLEEACYNTSDEIQKSAYVYASYLQHAFNQESRRFRNFMSYDRRWLKETNIEDAHGRAVWALGTCVGRSRNSEMRNFATKLFHESVGATSDFSSPRAWAFSILGIHEYLKTFKGDRAIMLIRDRLGMKLLELFEKNAGDGWLWPEDTLTYDNAKLSHALVVSGRDCGNEKMVNAGIASIEWLYSMQTAPAGYFRPVSTAGTKRGQTDRKLFDQQPLEAHSTLSTCLAVFRDTSDINWFRKSVNVFEWYMGRNDLGLDVYDPTTGGCRDGLHIDRLNFNQGAESTLSFLLSLVEMQIAQNEVKLFNS